MAEGTISCVPPRHPPTIAMHGGEGGELVELVPAEQVDDRDRLAGHISEQTTHDPSTLPADGSKLELQHPRP